MALTKQTDIRSPVRKPPHGHVHFIVMDGSGVHIGLAQDGEQEEKHAQRTGLNIMPRQKETLAEKLAATKLRIEEAKLAKIESDLPAPETGYIRYVDLPPLHPDDHLDLANRFTHLARMTEGERVAAEIEDAVTQWHAMNNWMRGQHNGAAQDKRETVPFWEGLTQNGYSLFDGGALHEDFIAAIFKGKEAQSEAVQAYHGENIVDVVFKGRRP